MVVRSADPGSLDHVVRSLASGGVAIIPCDTMYGIVGVAPETEDRIRRIKGRGESKPFLQLIGDDSWVARVSVSPLPPALSKYWPGPVTIVFAASGGGTVALRLPDSVFLQRLLTLVDRPLYSTSVNRAGNQPLFDVARIRQEFEHEVDVILDAGNLLPGPPSTLVDVTVRPYRVLRAGAVRIAPGDLA